MKFYGHTPSTDAYTNTMNRVAGPGKDDDLIFSSLFMSTDLASKNGSDKISPKNQKHICTTIAGLVGSGVQGVATIIDRTVCSEASTGHLVGCSTIVAVIGFQGSYLTASEVSDYCQEYISHNDKECSSQGVIGDTGNKRAHVAVVNSRCPLSYLVEIGRSYDLHSSLHHVL
ncbi:hypothetical protein SI65_07343 [Aspergillus cristatus]|uniref:Uncharacterized protein n=1 Tax=Aspergillus cristatus TaxID=573508 RepID=A0A1E3B7J4_ASPCR|nr:hypothetical protein SI65_07343 [Aspergillus cristatus]